MTTRFNVFLIDDHALLLESLTQRLEAEPDIHVVGTARHVEGALQRITGTGTDIVLMGIDLPGMSGLDGAARMMRAWPRIRIVFLSSCWHDNYIERALKLKVSGYLTKLESASRVVEAIRRVAGGEKVYSDEVRGRFEISSESMRNGHRNRTPLTTLTRREDEVLRHLAMGLHKSQIAGDMRISVKTVASHTSHIMRKLALHDRVELARYAIREGLVRA